MNPHKQKVTRNLLILVVLVAAGFGVMYVFGFISLGNGLPRFIKDPDSFATAPPDGCLAKPPISSELTQKFVNNKYGYSFQYPEGYAVTSNEDGKLVELLVRGDPIISFYIKPLAEGELVLSRISEGLRAIPQWQRSVYQFAKKGERIPDGEYPYIKVETFFSNSNQHPVAGFVLTSGLPQVRSLYIELPDGRDLVNAVEGSRCIQEYTLIIDKIFASIDPFGE